MGELWLGQPGRVLIDEHSLGRLGGLAGLGARGALGLLHQVGLSPGVASGRLPLELNFFPRLGGDCRLELCPPAVTEPRAKSEETLLDPGWSARSSQPEESVILHGTFPQVLAALLAGQPEDEDVLLLRPVLLLLHHDQGQLLLLEVQLHDLRPEKQTDFLVSLVDKNTCGDNIVTLVITVII